MPDTNRNGTSTLHHTSNAPVNLDSNSGSREPTKDEPAVQKRTRSQHNVSDLILRLPLSRSPFKDARKAHIKARGTSPISLAEPRLPWMGCGITAGTDGATEANATEAAPKTEEGKETTTCIDEQCLKEEGSQDSLFSLPSRERGPDDGDSGLQHTNWPTTKGKRTSPDTDAIRALSSPGGERQPKRAKVEGSHILDCMQDHSEYHEPLRDPDASTPSRPQSHRRVSSARQSPSPSKVASSIFLRSQSVPLGGGNEVRAIDLTNVPPSPRRSPSKGTVEIRRALSVPPPDDDRMDVDSEDNSALLHFSNPTQFATPRGPPVFHYTVNFATPRGVATPRSSRRSASPLSPLTPIPPSPRSERLPEMQSLLAKVCFLHGGGATTNSTPWLLNGNSCTQKVNVKPLALRDRISSTGSVPDGSKIATAISMGSVVSGSVDAFQPPPIRSPLTSSSSIELTPSLHAAAEGSNSTRGDMSSNNADDAEEVPTATFELSSPLSSSPGPNAPPISYPVIGGALQRKRGSFVSRSTRPVTRSVSMKVEGMKGRRSKIRDALATSDTTQASATSKPMATVPPPAEISSKPPSQKLSGALTLGLGLPPPTRGSTSILKPLQDPSKLKQVPLSLFMKTKPQTGGGDSATRASTNNASSSKLLSLSSPSKIPLPVSPSKRLPTTQTGSAKSSLFSLGSPSTGAGADTTRRSSGRSLSTLSHALDKLVVPPPSRPNTSMGFVREDEQSEEEGTVEYAKGKQKAKDDTSVPLTSTARGSGTTFARPTASSLNRAATVAGLGSTAMTKMRGRGGAAMRGMGKARGTIGIFGRAGDRASRKTTLPVVAGSPVKGSGDMDDQDRAASGAGKHKMISTLGDDEGYAGKGNVFVLPGAVESDKAMIDIALRAASATVPMNGRERATTQRLSPPPAYSASNATDIDLTMPISTDKGKQRVLLPSTLNPASSALHALSESLSSLPQTPTPPKPRVAGTRTGLRSSTTAAGKESPALDASNKAGPSGNTKDQGSGSTGPGSGADSDVAKKSSLKILKRCVIFVDVRTEQGDDAGSLFVDMLKSLGAKIMSRLGRKCTHIVYKNGLPATLTRYRMLDDPKPSVVGIAWVVECVEKRAKVDEERFKIDVDMINVAGSNHKRRRSMLPKHLIPASPGPESEMAMQISSEADDDDDRGGGMDGSPSQDPDISIQSREEEDLPPLERARRRRSVLSGGQTRLVP